MVCAATSAEVRDALLSHKIHHINEYSPITMIIVIGLFASLFMCAIPYKVPRTMITVLDDNGNNVHIRRCDEPADIKCPICLYNILELHRSNIATCYRVPCGHVLCSDCIRHLIQAKHTICPVCNGQFAENSLFELHLS